ncbi:MAG: response regulator [Candidatus Promineifilaceae bacterium]
MSLYLYAFPAAIGLIVAGLFLSLISLRLLWLQQTERAGHILAASLWLTVWGAVVNLGRLPVLACAVFALSIAAMYVWAMMRGVAAAESNAMIQTGWIRDLAERVDDMLWLISAESGIPLYVSPAYMRLTGKESIDLYTNPNAWGEMVHPDDAETFATRFAGSSEKSIDYRIITTSGESRWVRSHIWPQEDENGQVSAFAGITSDITERMRSPQLVPHTEIQNRLGTLASSPNNFNGALFGRMGQGSLANTKRNKVSPAQPSLERMMPASSGTKQITQQLLAYIGEAPMTPRKLNANLMIQGHRKALERSVPTGVALQTSLGRFLPMIEADESQLMMVIENLITNAIEAGARKVIVSTSVESGLADDSAEWQQIGDLETDNDYVAISITDNGPGIDSQIEQHMFEPYYTTKPEGIGLGLSTTLGIMRAHNGAVQVKTELRKGSVFKLLLPTICRIEPVKANDMNLVIDIPTVKTASQVMIIDDEDTVTEVVADLLELEGIDTLTANDGSSGVALYQRRQDDIGLVILDLTMPGMSGKEVFEALRKINPNVNVLISSGYGHAEVSRHFPVEALAGIIQKPFDIFTLVSEIRSHL